MSERVPVGEAEGIQADAVPPVSFGSAASRVGESAGSATSAQRFDGYRLTFVERALAQLWAARGDAEPEWRPWQKALYLVTLAALGYLLIGLYFLWLTLVLVWRFSLWCVRLVWRALTFPFTRRKPGRVAYASTATSVESPAVYIREPISLGLRLRVLERDGFSCVFCGRTVRDGARLEIDHRLPVALGGKSVLENLQTLCFECNRGKGRRLVARREVAGD